MIRKILLILSLLSQYSFSQNPAWQVVVQGGGAFSSAKSADLNGDGFEDIILGAGAEDLVSSLGVLCLNGQNGDTLWTIPTRNQIYTSAVFELIDGDMVPDIIIGGRRAQLFCLNGATGQKIWEFWPDSIGKPDTAGWLNFYSPFLIPDITGDGRRDIIITNGGDPDVLAGDPNRPPGKLMAINSLNGSVIMVDTMQDGAETYNSPIVLDHDNDGATSIFFGSGGETLPGGFWTVGLQDFLSNGLSNSTLITSDTNKGFIAVCSFADLNGDGVYDPIVPHMNSKLSAFDGSDFSLLWQVFIPGTENYVSPVPGNFTSRVSPDIFSIFSHGPWPFYSHFTAVLIDGSTGQVDWSDSLTYFQHASPNALDFDQDGLDEALFMENQDIGSSTVSIQNKWKLYDFEPVGASYLGGIRPGSNLFSTPLVKDLDSDGDLDLVYNFFPTTDSWYGFDAVGVGRWDLGFMQSPVPWGGYLGTFGDGTYRNNMISHISGSAPDEWTAFPNPANDRLTIKYSGIVSGQDRIKLVGMSGRTFWIQGQKRSGFKQEFDVSGLPNGIYALILPEGRSKKVLIIKD